MKTTSLEDRMTILTLAEAGHSDRDIAQRLGWKLSTVRKWRRRGQAEGRDGLTCQMGRPATGALSSFPPMVLEKLGAWRKAHPSWGPLTLRVELESDPSVQDEWVPARSSIAHR